MGRDAEDWTIIDAQANQPVMGGVGWARQSPPGHEFVGLPWSTWDKLADAAAKSDIRLFEMTLANHADAWKMYIQAASPDRQAIRAAFAAVKRRGQ